MLEMLGRILAQHILLTRGLPLHMEGLLLCHACLTHNHPTHITICEAILRPELAKYHSKLEGEDAIMDTNLKAQNHFCWVYSKSKVFGATHTLIQGIN